MITETDTKAEHAHGRPQPKSHPWKYGEGKRAMLTKDEIEDLRANIFSERRERGVL